MSFVEDNHEIKMFLQDFPYEVVHETDNSHTFEYYFVVMALDDDYKRISPYIFDVFSEYYHRFPLDMLSEQTQRFMFGNHTKYQFAFVDKLSLDDPFFKQKETFIRENANNIICKRLTGEYADPSLQIALQMENYFEQFKDISSHLGETVRQKAKAKLHAGKELLNEKAPHVKENIQELGSKLGAKLKQRFKR